MKNRRLIVMLSLACAVALPAVAEAQGFFESLFGGFRRAARAVPPAIETVARGYSNEGPGGFFPSFEAPIRGEGGPSSAYCVRTCDGRYFPVQAHAGLSVAEACNAFCPAAQTKIFTGAGIDQAVDNRGVSYSETPNAFAYRKQLVANCTCNGKTGGVAALDAISDPTLRPGDIVATKTGLMAYAGGRDKTAQFTPATDFRGFGKNTRDKLSEIKIAPRSRGASTTGATVAGD